MNPSHLEKYGLGLISNNYKIIPIKKGSKIPAVKGWTKIDADINQLEQWISAGHEGVGVLCKNNPAVDIDILDEEVSRQMVKAVLQKYPGAKPLRHYWPTELTSRLRKYAQRPMKIYLAITTL